jgi:hypothetical protein
MDSIAPSLREASTKLIARTDTHIVGVLDDVVIHRLIRATTLEYLANAAEGRRRALATRGGGYAVLVIVEPSAPLPDAAVRSAAKRLWKDTVADLRAHAIVLGGEGFWAAAVRSAAAAIMELGDERVPRTVVGNDRQAISFLAHHLGRPPSFTTDLERAARDIRAIPA